MEVLVYGTRLGGEVLFQFRDRILVPIRQEVLLPSCFKQDPVASFVRQSNRLNGIMNAQNGEHVMKYPILVETACEVETRIKRNPFPVEAAHGSAYAPTLLEEQYGMSVHSEQKG